MQFEWSLDNPYPPLEEHTKAKLDVLRKYLEAYFLTVASSPFQRVLKLDLVDGFCGGGLYRHSGSDEVGSPLVMLEETRAAEVRLNKNRKNPLAFDVQYHFVDKEKAHTQTLAFILENRDWYYQKDRIQIHNSSFRNAVDPIIESIARRQPKSGRSIFLLDQTGYLDVDFATIRKIFGKLRNVEVILTFGTDALLNFARDDPGLIKSLARIELTRQMVLKIIEARDDNSIALVQRTLRRHIRSATGVQFDTPFFIRPQKSRRTLWFVHLSNHPKARDVMLQKHWELDHHFTHFGKGSFGMLGWDAIQNRREIGLFDFRQIERDRLHEELLDQLPNRLYDMCTIEPTTLDAIHWRLANQTAATYDDMDLVIKALVREKEFAVINSEGKVRRITKRSVLAPTDRIVLPRERILSGLSRIDRDDDDTDDDD